jgi:D-alanyl-D-alanine dipeptidase
VIHSDLIEIQPGDHDLRIDLIYATADNIAKRVIYQDPKCYLHRDAASRLAKASTIAQLAGYRLLVLDAYRPPYAQALLWKALPNADYVRDPALGSHHSRGVAVDVTLIDGDGVAVDMGTGFDDMRELSHPFNPDLPPTVQRHRILLLGIMMGAGFAPIDTEWWHFELPDADNYPLIDFHHLSDADLAALIN